MLEQSGGSRLGIVGDSIRQRISILLEFRKIRMDDIGGIVVLLVLFVIWMVIAPIVALVKAGDARRVARAAEDRLTDAFVRLRTLESELRELKRGSEESPLPPPATASRKEDAEDE